MENLEQLIKRICDSTDYDELLLEIVTREKDNKIVQVLKDISNNKKLTKKEKIDYYSNIFDFVKDINNNYESKIKDIYNKSLHDSSIKLLMLSDYLKKEIKLDIKLENDMNDYILKRLERNSKIIKNVNFKNKLKTIEKELKSEKLKEVYSDIRDLEAIDSYKIGFYDALQILLSY